MKYVVFGAMPFVLAAMLAANPVCAQLHKWVDRHGVTNYSDQPPADPAAVKAYLRQAMDAQRNAGDRAAAEGASRPEMKPGVEPGQPPQAAAVAQDPCSYPRSSGCTESYAGNLPYYPSYGFPIPRHWPREFVQPYLRPGATAGNVVGMDGFIPGYAGSSTQTRTTHGPRALYEAPPARAQRRR